jgi:hypothetical protein
VKMVLEAGPLSSIIVCLYESALFKTVLPRITCLHLTLEPCVDGVREANHLIILTPGQSHVKMVLGSGTLFVTIVLI